MKEIEILIEVKDTKEAVLEVLKQFEDCGVKKTLDIYFVDPLRGNLKPSVSGRLAASFRVRQKDSKNSIAYKIDHFNDDEWSHSDEYETEVKDFDTAIKVVKNLGLIELVRIDNEKHTFLTPEYEIVLEDVKGLGLYMEVEKLSEVPDGEVVKTKEEIRKFLQSLGVHLGEEQNAGKPELMLKKLKA